MILLLELLKFHVCVLILFVILAFTKCEIVYNEFFIRRVVSYLLFTDAKSLPASQISIFPSSHGKKWYQIRVLKVEVNFPDSTKGKRLSKNPSMGEFQGRLHC